MIKSTAMVLALVGTQPVPVTPTEGQEVVDASDQAPPKDLARPARTRDDLKWARQILAGYPAKAKRDGLEGSVGLSVAVTPEGRATACRVTQSSGHTILDEAACNGMLRFARFTPALDSNGVPTTGSYSIRIRYFNQ